MDFDKFKSCKGCPDRTALPNCHSTCEGYLTRCEQAKELKEKKKQAFDIEEYIRRRKQKIFKMQHHGWKG